LIKVGLLPTKIDKLGRAEPVPESDQDHRRVPVALPIVLGRLDEALDLWRRQVLTGRSSRFGGRPAGRPFAAVRFSGSGLTRLRRGVIRKSFHSSLHPCALVEKRTVVSKPFHQERARSVAFFLAIHHADFARSGRSSLRRSKRALVSVVEKGRTERQSMSFGAAFRGAAAIALRQEKSKR
jgi:hypothetical protein